jgi:hypothetical protein
MNAYLDLAGFAGRGGTLSTRNPTVSPICSFSPRRFPWYLWDGTLSTFREGGAVTSGLLLPLSPVGWPEGLSGT